MPLIHLDGPPTSKVSHAEAVAKLKRNPNLPQGADFEVWEHEGHWIAAAVVQSGPPFGAPADTEEEAPGPKSEGPDDTAPAPDDGPPKGPEDGAPEDGDEGEGPPKDEKKDEKGGDKHLEHEIYDGIQKIMDALGLTGMGPEDSPVPGEEGPPAPPGPPGPPAGPPGGAGQTIQHEKAMKPGESPPGSLPVGAPAFSSVDPHHPWSHMIDKTASFTVQERWPADRSLDEPRAELTNLARTAGLKLKQTTRGVDDDGFPTVEALISKY